ncbi:uncharacterized protein METZ01_LOCUS274749, partial [marine metagenome]
MGWDYYLLQKYNPIYNKTNINKITEIVAIDKMKTYG